ncbi:MAG: bacteriophage Gp15 family protein [Culicoidibacterales bacterium]
MNILVDYLPQTSEFDGVSYQLRTDFRAFIQFALFMQDVTLSDEEKISRAFEATLAKWEPEYTVEGAIQAIIQFYRYGQAEKAKEIPLWKKLNPEQETPIEIETTQKQAKQTPAFCFNHDANLIYAAFMSQYQIDLQAVELHWWQFKSLFDSLDENTQFMKIVGYRTMDLSKIKDKEQKAFYKKMKELYKLPEQSQELDEQSQDLIRALMNGTDVEQYLQNENA